ncbi:hypothetical protein CQ018_03440 [Arthrobacter sp. MYb227]|uniref:alpha/beta hydrolase n=1 Tax=Arthrobacter sp. MYb227 TaxID=1848601 RepID=UPI000CFCD19F|nr:alpha/beta hydrolase [Arthrobacter sp. MYb227]PQZ96331.1 hypothetical protein CQ018_03440 [Arthrobacter sp. MYb227]
MLPLPSSYARLHEHALFQFDALCTIRGRLRTAHRQALDGAAHALRPGSMEPAIPPRRLLYLDFSGCEPLAAIAVGDLDTATHVTWQLSGTGIRARNALWGSAREAGELYLEQRKVGIDAPAVVAWLGYRSPNLGTALLNASARRGVKVLSRDLEIFAALRGDQPHLALEAHSYAASMAAQALDARADFAHRVDALVTIGSAGFPSYLTKDIGRVGVPAEHLYTAIASQDSLARWGRLLSGRKHLAAQCFAVTAREDLGLAGVSGHNTSQFIAGDPHSLHGYRDPGTTSLRNIALITTGQIPLGP